MNMLVEIRAAEGGHDAKLLVMDQYRLYKKVAVKECLCWVLVQLAADREVGKAPKVARLSTHTAVASDSHEPDTPCAKHPHGAGSGKFIKSPRSMSGECPNADGCRPALPESRVRGGCGGIGSVGSAE